MASSYDSIRSSIQASGSDARVEVNQRALIDKVCLDTFSNYDNKFTLSF